MPRPRTLLLTATAVAALAAPVPALAVTSGHTGQPNQSCEDQPAQPPGFGTGGFANAQDMYAGSGPGSTTHNASANAVSQYDVACLQVSSR
jgi:hypothetical protein